MSNEINYGKLMDYHTGEKIREATKDDLESSLDAAATNCDGTGVFLMGKRSVYVTGESNLANRMCGGRGLSE
jgi:hypothetical protein